MKNLFVSTHIAKMLDNRQYNEPCLGYYITNNGDYTDVELTSKPLRNSDLVNGAFSTPTHQQVIDWFREQHNIILTPLVFGSSTKILGYEWIVNIGMKDDCYKTKSGSYYESLNKAIEHALTLI